MARELAKILDYTDFKNFKPVIDNAIEACKNRNYNVNEHIVEAIEVVLAGQVQCHLSKSFFNCAEL